jgi:hypothetical protein
MGIRSEGPLRESRVESCWTGREPGVVVQDGRAADRTRRPCRGSEGTRRSNLKIEEKMYKNRGLERSARCDAIVVRIACFPAGDRPPDRRQRPTRAGFAAIPRETYATASPVISGSSGAHEQRPRRPPACRLDARAPPKDAFAVAAYVGRRGPSCARMASSVLQHFDLNIGMSPVRRHPFVTCKPHVVMST